MNYVFPYISLILCVLYVYIFGDKLDHKALLTKLEQFSPHLGAA